MVAVSGQPSAAYFWSLFLGFDQVRTARPSHGSQIAIRHPGKHTMLSYSTPFGSICYGHAAVKFGSGIGNAGHRLWASGEHIILSYQLHMQSGLIWYDKVTCGKIGLGIKTSGHCIRASGEHATLRYSTAYAVWFQFMCGNALEKFDWVVGLQDSTSGNPGSKQSSAILLHM